MTEHDVRRRFAADIDTDKLAEAALAILSLTLHDGGRVWKGLDWDLMDLLEEKGWLVDFASVRRTHAISSNSRRLGCRGRKRLPRDGTLIMRLGGCLHTSLTVTKTKNEKGQPAQLTKTCLCYSLALLELDSSQSESAWWFASGVGHME